MISSLQNENDGFPHSSVYLCASVHFQIKPQGRIPLDKCWSYPHFCSQLGSSLEFNVAACSRAALKVNSSLPVDFLMSSSWTAGLVCVTGYFQ